MDGRPEARSVSLECASHGQRVLAVLQGMRERRALFDFSIRVHEETLPCHRCVLAACSDFFRAMFELDMRERGDGTVTLSNLSAPAVRSFLDFAYSGAIEIREDNVDELFQLAAFLQVSFLSHACADFLAQTLSLSNCLQLLALAESYGSAHLQRRASDFITQNFHTLSSAAEFMEMPSRVLERCLESDALTVPDEAAVLIALLRWTRHDPRTRENVLPKLLPRVRLHHLPLAALEEAAREPLLTRSVSTVSVVSEALMRVRESSGLFDDARPSTTSSYIFVHKTDESAGIRYAFCYDVSGDRWMELPGDAPRIIDLPGSAIVGFAEKLFVIGGCRGNCSRAIRLHIAAPAHDATDEVWCYCPVARNFTPVRRMHHARSMHTAVAALRRIYAIGGKNVLHVECYDPLNDTWTRVSPLPKQIYFPEASACGSVIYTLGSEVEISDAFNPSLDCFFRYDAAVDQWSQLVPEFGRFFHATLVKTVSVNATLFLCDLSSYKLCSFCADGCVWTDEGSFECAGFNAAAIAVGDQIFVLGGDYSPGEISDEVQVFDRERAEWRELSPMPRPLTEFTCQVLSFSRYRDPWRTSAD